MKTVAVVGPKKSGKTQLVTALVRSLGKHGRVGTIKHMPGHSADKGDTRRHFEAGAQVVLGVGESLFKVSRDNDLESALDELCASGVDFAIVEGFKQSDLPKIVLGGIDVPNAIREIDIADLNEETTEELTRLVISQRDRENMRSLVYKAENHPEYDKIGAIGTFTGIVRARTKASTTKYLEIEAIHMDEQVEEVESLLREREGIVDVWIAHSAGKIPAGDVVMNVVVAASHRQELFGALRDAVEMLKARFIEREKSD
jgi:molybdopterin synthase catalytic subunit